MLAVAAYGLQKTTRNMVNSKCPRDQQFSEFCASNLSGGRRTKRRSKRIRNRLELVVYNHWAQIESVGWYRWEFYERRRLEK